MGIKMKNLVEKLVKKHLDRMLKDIAKTTAINCFQFHFKKVCECRETTNTTMGETFRILDAIAVRELEKRLENFKNQCMDFLHEPCVYNPLIYVIEDLLNEFLMHFELKDCFDGFLGDERSALEEHLFSCGVIDEFGDYIKK